MRHLLPLFVALALAAPALAQTGLTADALTSDPAACADGMFGVDTDTAAALTCQYIRHRTHATDCTSLVDGLAGESCCDEDDGSCWWCLPSAGDCDTVGEWEAVGGGTPTSIAAGDSSVTVTDAGTGQVGITVDGGVVGEWLAGGLGLGTTDLSDPVFGSDQIRLETGAVGLGLATGGGLPLISLDDGTVVSFLYSFGGELILGTNTNHSIVLRPWGRSAAMFTSASVGVNYAHVTSAATGSGPTIAAAGDDTNIDLNLAGKGTGDVVIGSDLSTSGAHFEAIVRVTTTPYNVGAGIRNIVADTDGTAITVNLPAGVAGRVLRIVNVGTSANDVTIDGDGAETVRGAATRALPSEDIIIIKYEPTEGWW